jgi:predicted  nucleic acid-binding Zn-ribbon protein
MSVDYGLSQDLKDLAAAAENLTNYTVQLEEKVEELEKELADVSNDYQELVSYIDGVDENIVTAFEAQRKLA